MCDSAMADVPVEKWGKSNSSQRAFQERNSGQTHLRSQVIPPYRYPIWEVSRERRNIGWSTTVGQRQWVNNAMHLTNDSA